MKIIKKIPKSDENKNNQLINEGFTKLKQPKTLGKAIILSIPIMFLLATISYILMSVYSPIDLKKLGLDLENSEFKLSLNLLSVFLYLFILAYIHEFIHIVFIPNFYKSQNIFYGMSWFGAFVYTTERLKKKEFIIISIMPFLIISVLLPFLLYVIGLLTLSIQIIILFNAMASSVDFLNVALVIKQCNKNSILVMNGDSTYCKN